MNILLCIIGESGSGKDYYCNNALKGSFLKLISTTTREKRIDEKDGEDYYFISKDKFNEINNNNGFSEVVEYNGNLYGYEKKELDKIKESNCFAIVTPDGFKQLSHIMRDYMCIPIYIETNPETRKKKLLERHSKEENISFYKNQIDERFVKDRETFKDVRKLKNIVVFRHSYTKPDFLRFLDEIENIKNMFSNRKYRKVICDFDDVIVPTLEEAIKIYNHENNANLIPDMFKVWDSNKVATDFIEYFKKIDFSKILEKNNSIKYLREINKHYEVVIATASCKETFCQKEEWILKNMPFIPWKNISCVRNKDLLVGYAIIDDGAHNLKNNNSTIKFLYDAPHNKDFNDCDARISSLEDVYTILVKGLRGFE